jgi:hypothetical protein
MRAFMFFIDGTYMTDGACDLAGLVPERGKGLVDF